MTRIISAGGLALPPTGAADGGQGSKVSPRFADQGNGQWQDEVLHILWDPKPWQMIPGTALRTTKTIYDYQPAAWVAETAYALNDAIADGEDSVWACLVAHTSGAVSMATDRAAHPTYWVQLPLYDFFGGPGWLPATITNAPTRAAGLTWNGASGWRLPNVLELITLYQFASAGIASPFADSFYWTSKITSGTPGGNGYYYVDFSNTTPYDVINTMLDEGSQRPSFLLVKGD